jgi:ribonuclease BN (tRNA processing enzyme)
MTDDHTTPTPSSPEDIQKAMMGGVPAGKWKEGLLFEGIRPTPGLKSAANWFPKTEKLGPDEMQIIFMGTAPAIRPGQMNTSVFVRLGNGDSFIFDIGEGAIANYVAGGFALNELNNIFLTHLHIDHFGSLPYLYMFGGYYGRWHEPLRIFGPDGRTEKDGLAYMIDGMQRMLHWHRDAFDVFPLGQGWDIEVNEFDHTDNGGVIYDENGVQVTHWQRSHCKDGASGYRLDWNGLSVVWTGDGRPNELDIEYCEGVDVFITETQPELLAISSGVQGVPPFLGRYTVDTHHTPSYATGYIANQINPRLLMTTHMPFDAYVNEETVVEIREHWKGPFHFGAPDGVVVNVTKDDIWVREGILPDYPNMRAPQQDFTDGALVVPVPNQQRVDMQDPFIREKEIDPAKYYPEGYHPELMMEWPVDTDLVVPVDVLPETMSESMGENWRDRQAYKKHISELAAKTESEE